MSMGLHLWLALLFVFFTCQQALLGSFYIVNIFFCSPSLTSLSLEYGEKRRKLIPMYPSLLSFCHPEAHLVNVPSESIGLRDGGAQGVAGCSSEPSILGTWEMGGGVPPAC